jgi:hypothetical protein
MKVIFVEHAAESAKFAPARPRACADGAYLSQQVLQPSTLSMGRVERAGRVHCDWNSPGDNA